MKRTILITLGLCLAVVSAQAGGPTYSRFGLGDIFLYGGPRAYAMGLTGVALTGDGFINGMNPAGLAGITRTRISGGFEFLISTLTDQSGSQDFSRGGFQGLSLAIPASTDDGLVLFAQTNPFSRVDYNAAVRSTQPPTPVTQEFKGLGGLSNLSLGASYRPHPDLDLGLKFTYHYGTIQQVAAINFDDPSFEDSELQTSLFHSGSSFTFGLAFRGINPIVIGLMVTTPAKLSVKEERILLTSTSSDTTVVARGTTDLPLSIGLGASYVLGERTVLSGEVFFQQWESANFFGIPPVGIRNSTRVGLGVEFQPPRNPDTYLSAVAYRAGFTYHSTYYSLNGQPINEWYGSAGAGLPIGPDSRLHLGIQVGSRGTVSGSVPKESFFRLSASFSASELWFITIEED